MNQQEEIIILFLDIDGVLLPFPDPLTVKKGRIFPDCTVAALSRILETTFKSKEDDDHDGSSNGNPRIEIVLSSTWRVSASMRSDVLNDFHLYGHGPLASMNDFFDITDPTMHSERQHEIYEWLMTSTTAANNNIVAWICLDDEELIHGTANELRRPQFEGHVIHCDSRTGLTMDQANEAVQLISVQLRQNSIKNSHN